jgi:hypothetical protein
MCKQCENKFKNICEIMKTNEKINKYYVIDIQFIIFNLIKLKNC